MISFTIELDVGSVTRMVQALERAIPSHVEAGLSAILDRTAEQARASHPYTNRSGRLQQETQARGIEGDFFRDNLTGEVRADTFYASFVEERGFEFLAPAYERIGAEAESLMEQQLDAAAAQAGWK